MHLNTIITNNTFPYCASQGCTVKIIFENEIRKSPPYQRLSKHPFLPLWFFIAPLPLPVAPPLLPPGCPPPSPTSCPLVTHCSCQHVVHQCAQTPPVNSFTVPSPLQHLRCPITSHTHTQSNDPLFQSTLTHMYSTVPQNVLVVASP